MGAANRGDPHISRIGILLGSRGFVGVVHYNRKPPKAHAKADPSANRRRGQEREKIGAPKDVPQRRSSAALRWAAAFAARYSSGWRVQTARQEHFRRLFECVVRTARGRRIGGFKLPVARVSIWSMDPERPPHHERHPGNPQRREHQPQPEQSARNLQCEKPSVQSKAALQHCSVMAL